MAQLNSDTHIISMIAHLTNEEQNAGERLIAQVAEHFLSSPWYCDITYVLKNLQAPQGIERTKARFLK